MSLQTQSGPLDQYIIHKKKPQICRECRSWQQNRCRIGYSTGPNSMVCRQAT